VKNFVHLCRILPVAVEYYYEGACKKRSLREGLEQRPIGIEG